MRKTERPTTIRFPADARRELRMMAAREDRKMEEIIVEAFDLYQRFKASGGIIPWTNAGIEKLNAGKYDIAEVDLQLFSAAIRTVGITKVRDLLHTVIAIAAGATRTTDERTSETEPSLPYPDLPVSDDQTAVKDRSRMDAEVHRKSARNRKTAR